MPDINDARAKKAQGLPESVQFAIATSLPNIVNGAFWGFTEVSECRKFAGSLKADNNIHLRKLQGGNFAIVEVNPDYLIKAVQMVDASLIRPQDINAMRTGIAEGTASFEKFLISKADKNFKSVVGIYCINDTTAIAYKGTSYPSFRVDIRTALTLLGKWGYAVVVGNSLVSAQVASQQVSKLFDSMVMSPTKTGVFMRIASTLNKEQVDYIKVQVGLKKPKANK